MIDWTAIAIGSVPAIGGAFAAWVAGRASSRTQRITGEVQLQIEGQNAAIERARVEIEQSRASKEAVDQLRAIYEQMIGDLRTEIERTQRRMETIQGQSDRLGEQLAKEQDVSNTLRNQIYALQEQLRQHKADMAELERTMRDRDRQLEELRQQIESRSMVKEG